MPVALRYVQSRCDCAARFLYDSFIPLPGFIYSRNTRSRLVLPSSYCISRFSFRHALLFGGTMHIKQPTDGLELAQALSISLQSVLPDDILQGTHTLSDGSL